MREATVCYLVDQLPARRVLLGFKKRGFGTGKYSGAGGKLEANETAKEAAVRELGEEIQVIVRPEDLVVLGRVTFYFPANPNWDFYVHIFATPSWDGTPTETDEIRPQWFDVAEIPYTMMWQDAPHWLPHVLRGAVLDAAFTFADDNEIVAKSAVRFVEP